MSSVPTGWASDRLKDVAAINAIALSAGTDLDYEFDYLEISNVDYHGIYEPARKERAVARSGKRTPVSGSKPPDSARRAPGSRKSKDEKGRA
jgi:hypothetical protein